MRCKAVPFGIRPRLTAKATGMSRLYMFENIMVRGALHSLRHVHELIGKGNGTLVTGRFLNKSPFGLIAEIHF